MTSENLDGNQVGTEFPMVLDNKNRQILGALASTLTGGLKLAEYQPGSSPFVDGFMDFFNSAQHDASVLSDAKKVGAITTLGVLLLDSVLIDELTPYVGTTPTKGKASYGRSEAAEIIRDFPIIDDFLKSNEQSDRHYRARMFTQEEMYEWDRLSKRIYGKNDSLLYYETLDAYLDQTKSAGFNTDYPQVYISRPITLEDFLKVKDTLFGQNIPKIFGLEFYVQVGKFYLRITPYQQPRNFAIGFMPDAPDQTIPRAELWKAYINEGFPIFEQEGKSETTAEALSPQSKHLIEWGTDMQRLIQLYGQDKHLPGVINRRKYSSFLSHQRERDLRYYLDSSIDHVKREFAKAEESKPHVRITRSGASANLLGCYIAADFVGGELGFESHRAACYVDPDFYYENKDPLNHSNFKIVDSFDEANIFALSADINSPRETQSDFLIRRKETVQKIIDKARACPDGKYSIVYDKTAAPDSDLFAQNSDIPSNLQVIETYSFSKFQRGGRNAFYGTVLYKHDVDAKKLDIFERQSLSSPSEYNIVTFPHVTKGEMQRIIQRNDELFTQIKDDVAKPENAMKMAGWSLVKANFYFFLLPPKKYWQERGKVALAMSSHSVNEIGSSGIVEVGDSYGTLNTRLTAFVMRDSMGESPSKKFIPGVRISYGLKPTVEQITRTIDGVIQSYKEVDEILETTAK